MPWPGWSIPPVESVIIIKKSCEAIIKELKKLEEHGNDPYQMRLPDIIDILEEMYHAKEYK
jgi:hypothetical protein